MFSFNGGLYKNKMKFTTAVLFVTFLSLANGAKILGVFPIPSVSHQIVYHALLEELARRGHDVTVLTTNPNPNPPAGFTQIDVGEMSYKAARAALSYADMGTKGTRPIQFYDRAKTLAIPIFEKQLETPEMQEIINNRSINFDLIFVESLTRATFAFKHRFKDTPIIGISSMIPDLSSWHAVGNPTHPLLYPDAMQVYLFNMTLWEKLETLYDYYFILSVDRKLQPIEDKAMRKLFGEDMPSCHDLEKQMDMLFLNVNPLFLSIRPTVPAVVYIERLHLKERKQLPKDLQKYLDDSPQGVIYMSLGSNVKSKDLSQETLLKILDAFRELPYNFVWKFEDDHIPNLPKNVVIQKWLPQQDLLGHKNIKGFIFQGGLQSLEEAIRDKIPLICFPFVVDQIANAQKIEKLGIGIRMNIKTFTKDDFKDAITSIVEDTRYKENMSKFANLVEDQPVPPMERAIWWTEYVLRHKGAKHLKSPAAGVSFSDYFMLDVVAALLGTFAIVVIVLFLLIRKVASMLMSNKIGLPIDKSNKKKA